MKYQRVIYLWPGAIAWVMSLGLLVPVAWAQGSRDSQTLNQRLERLEATSENNNRQVAQAMNLLHQIQGEFQSIRGQLQASQYTTKESDRVYQDLDLRVSSLEDKIDQIHTLLKELTSLPPEGRTKSPVSSKEYEEYQTLLNMVNARDYQAAASGFLGFLKKYPKSSYAGNARYWVAECYYSLGDFAKAIKEFQKMVDGYPNNPRVKEAVFKQGLSFMRLKKYPEAKLFFQKVLADYPNSAEAAKAQARLFRLEEMEKNQVALGQDAGSGKQVSSGTSGKEETIYRPIMKPNPMPRAQNPSSPAPMATPVSTPDANSADQSARPANAEDSKGIPLF